MPSQKHTDDRNNSDGGREGGVIGAAESCVCGKHANKQNNP